MSKIIKILLLLSVIFICIPDPAYAQSQIKACDNPTVHARPLQRSRTDFTENILLSDDLKAEFTIDVNREANESGSNIKEWYMEWQCGVALGPVIPPYQKNKAQHQRRYGYNKHH